MKNNKVRYMPVASQMELPGSTKTFWAVLKVLFGIWLTAAIIFAGYIIQIQRKQDLTFTVTSHEAQEIYEQNEVFRLQSRHKNHDKFDLIKLNMNEKCPLNSTHKMCQQFICYLCSCSEDQQIIEWNKESTDLIQDLHIKQIEDSYQKLDSSNEQYVNVEFFQYGFPVFYNDRLWGIIKKQDFSEDQDTPIDLLDLFEQLNTQIDIFMLYNKQWVKLPSKDKIRPLHKKFFENIGSQQKQVDNAYKYHLLILGTLQKLIKANNLKIAPEIAIDGINYQNQLFNLQKWQNAEFKNYNKLELEGFQEKIKEQISQLHCVECERCKAFLVLQYQALNVIIETIKCENNQCIQEISENDLHILYHSYEVSSQNIHYMNDFYEQFFKSRKNLGYTIFSATLAALLFISFALKVKMQMKARVKKMFKHTIPKETKID